MKESKLELLNPAIKILKMANKKLTLDFVLSGSFEFTKYELFLIEVIIKQKISGMYKLPTVMFISKRLSLDFIGWNSPEFNDVLLCKRSKFYGN